MLDSMSSWDDFEENSGLRSWEIELKASIALNSNLPKNLG